jgi:hypothetical protein
MRAWVVPAAVVAALAVATPAQAARGCHPAGSHLQAKDALVRVFSVKSALFACRTGGRRVTLQRAGVGWEPRPGVHARGANVGFVSETCDEFSCYPGVTVMHVRRRSARELTTAYPLDQREGSVRIERFLLGSAAALVWVECQQISGGRFHCAPGGESQKRVAFQRGAFQTSGTLASGTGIDPQSLRLSGDVASWIDGGQPQSAPIR